MRQLVTLRKVSKIVPIENANYLELALVDGWQCIVKKGEFKTGDTGIYFEIDSILPAQERFSFLERYKYRVRTIKLRGILSQGVLLPLNVLTDEEQIQLKENLPLDYILGVTKYEPPLPLGGPQKGGFPNHLVPKTDEERIQNIPNIFINGIFKNKIWEISEKLDGTSCTIWYNHVKLQDQDLDFTARVGIASRNYELDQTNANIYTYILATYNLVKKLSNLNLNIALQGEIVGPKVQGNKYKLTTTQYYIFNIYDIDAKKYFSFADRYAMCLTLGLPHVPVTYLNTYLDSEGHSVASLLKLAEGPSKLYETEREGIVFKCDTFSFKVINNNYLLKEKKNEC